MITYEEVTVCLSKYAKAIASSPAKSQQHQLAATERTIRAELASMDSHVRTREIRVSTRLYSGTCSAIRGFNSSEGIEEFITQHQVEL